MSTPPSPNTSLRPFSTPSYLIVDNFYEFPDDIRTFALSQTFHLHTNYHKGHRTNDSFHFPGIQKRFESLLGRRIDNWHKYSTNACFQYCIAGDQLVYHFDFQQYAAIIFLSPNAPPHSGTSLFRSKITLNMKVSDNEISTVFKHGYLDSSQFDIVDKIFSLQESKDVKGNIRTILHELFEYIKVHFKDEEEFMKSINYPDLAYHIELHEQLVKSVSAILRDPSRLDIIQMKMRVIAKQALIDHILEEDMNYQRYYFSLKKSETDTIDEPIINLDI